MSFVERLSLFRSVHYQRFHCSVMHFFTFYRFRVKWKKQNNFHTDIDSNVCRDRLEIKINCMLSD